MKQALSNKQIEACQLEHAGWSQIDICNKVERTITTINEWRKLPLYEKYLASLKDVEKCREQEIDGIVNLHEAKAKKEHYNAELVRIEFEEKARKLVPLAEVEKLLFDVATIFKERVQALPPRLAPVCASIQDSREIQELLDAESHELCEGLSASFEAYVRADDGDSTGEASESQRVGGQPS